MNPLANPYVRIAIGAVVTSYLAPKVINKFVRPELDERDEAINTATAVGITAAGTTIVFIALGMLTGKSAAQAAAPGGAA